MNPEIISKNLDIFKKRLYNLFDKEIAMFQDQLYKQLEEPVEPTEPLSEEQEPTEPLSEEPVEPTEPLSEEQEPLSEPKPLPKKQLKPKTQKVKCPFILKSGKNKGECCGKNVKDTDEFCSKHTKKTPEPSPETQPTPPDQILERITIDGKTVLSDGSSLYQEIDNNFIEIGKINNGIITYI